jgi:hypothetical protein
VPARHKIQGAVGSLLVLVVIVLTWSLSAIASAHSGQGEGVKLEAISDREYKGVATCDPNDKPHESFQLVVTGAPPGARVVFQVMKPDGMGAAAAES